MSFRHHRFAQANLLLCAMCAMCAMCRTTHAQEVPRPVESARPHNIILFISDGAGPAHSTMARELARYLDLRETLFVDPYLVGSVGTTSARERITDSASSATTYATGYKTYNGAIGVDTLRRPLRTVLEAAAAKGLATGLVATSRITHATPAAFAAHVPDREMENDIAVQLIDQEVDVLLGGGRRHFIPAASGGDRADDRNLLDEARSRGVHVVTEPVDLAAADALPLLGLLAADHLPYEIDVLGQNHVDLAAMTAKALELLQDDPDGFFLLVEGSRIDHASHENDPAAALREVLAYDDAFEIARRFAARDGRTLVLAVSDHETGGISPGRALPTGRSADVPPTFWRSLASYHEYDWRPDVLAAVRASAIEMEDAIEGGKDARLVLRASAGIELRPEEAQAIDVARGRGALHLVIGEIVSRRAAVGWTTSGHTATDVNLYGFGPGSDLLRGHVDNTAVGRFLFEMLDVEMGLEESFRKL